MQLTNERDKFILDAGIAYFNFAYMAPVLRSSCEAIELSMLEIQQPYLLNEEKWFEPVNELRSLYAELVGTDDSNRIAITPSCSYGIANAARQIRPTRGSNIVIAAGQFPSNYYAWKRLCSEFNCELREVKPAKGEGSLSNRWNVALLNAIDERTAVVAIAPLFHADGTVFNLKNIGEQCHAKKALLIVDGTQAIGAMPFKISEIKPDALICSCYKWLFGPYGTGMAYYGSFFDDGIPIEENWITHKGCEDFSKLNQYTGELQIKGKRYSSGQHSSFLNIPFLLASAKQVLNWGTHNIQNYTRQLFRPFRYEFESLGCEIEPEDQHAHHLFGIRFGSAIDMNQLKQTMFEQKVYASIRADALRISLHLLNTEDDIARLLSCIKKHI